MRRTAICLLWIVQFLLDAFSLLFRVFGAVFEVGLIHADCALYNTRTRLIWKVCGFIARARFTDRELEINERK
jgi:hypothetical protein